MKHKKTLPGFILLEVLIALMILGITLQGGIRLIKHVKNQEKAKTTTQRQEQILRTLAAHGATHGRLPWAAGNDGIEEAHTKRQRGNLPFKTLGLPKSFARDGYGHAFVYLVAKTNPCRLAVSPLENYCRATPITPLINTTHPIAGEDFVIIALISRDPAQKESSLKNTHAFEDSNNTAWATRDTLMTLYGGLSCAPFRQPMPETHGRLPRGFGR